jgi:AraC-like DNA-binding protein
MYDGTFGALSVARTDGVLMAKLLAEALTLLDRDNGAARRRIEDAYALIPVEHGAGRARNGSLADWQLQRAEAYIRENLGSRLRIASVARVVNLSSSYFSRAFSVTKGMPYSEFVLVSRIALAKKLLSTTDMPIVQIALRCGLSDQSHLTRVFSQAVGVPPRAWRCRSTADLQARVCADRTD